MDQEKTICVTGGAGFIGSALVRRLISDTRHRVINVDALTYAGTLGSLKTVRGDPRHHLEEIDIRDRRAVRGIFDEYRPDAVIHLAAESHVDRSIDSPSAFVETNVLGTFVMLEEARRHWYRLEDEDRGDFRFVHVSTDEVFGSLGSQGRFRPDTPYDPSSPYSASKSASDHLARAWHRTYGLPTLITNCSNNYGPYQFPEKLVPLMILNALEGRELPVYGTGENVRDWLYVGDHVDALILALNEGEPGETYLVGGYGERTNLMMVETICDLIDEMQGPRPTGPRRQLIRFVEDRPGHDQRYAIDPSITETALGWRPRHSLEDGIRQTIRWYLDNSWWWEPLLGQDRQTQRLGLETGWFD